jgi:hypothetical protein
MFKDRIPATLAEEGLVADKHISRSQLPRFEFGEEAVGLPEGAHQ